MGELRAFGLTPREEAFLLLVSAGLWERKVEELLLFPLSTAEWQEIMELARIQTVQGLVFRGIQFLPPEMMPEQEFLWKCMPDLVHIESAYKKVSAAVGATGALLTSLGCRPILQKGVSVARFYEQPQWRVNGDIDWYIGQPDMLRNVVGLLKASGYVVHPHADASFSFEQDGVEVELHPCLMDLLSPKGRKAVSELSNIEEPEVMTLSESHSVSVPGPMSTLLLLESHLMKHVSTVGIGLRQFCDLARAFHTLYGHYNAAAFMEILQHSGLSRWHQLLTLFLVRILGQPSADVPVLQENSSPRTKELRWMLHDVLRSGNFGQHTATWNSRSLKHNGFFTHTLRQIFVRLPFSFRYAPMETFCQMRTLAYNRIKIKLNRAI